MSLFPRKLTLAAGLILALAASGGVASADSVSQDMVDARQERQIWTAYALSPHLRGGNLVALVQSGMVRLTGDVTEYAWKDLAAEIAAGVAGVRSVDNQILVRPGRTVAETAADRNFGELVDDAGVSAEVKAKLAWSRLTQGLHAIIDTTRGAVRLRGTADSTASKDIAGRLAATTRGVGVVDNQLTVTGVPLSRLESDTAQPNAPGQAISDGLITAKVRSTLLYSIDTPAADIAVSTLNGDVTLNGQAKNEAERALVLELAQNVRGVRSVNSQGYRF